MILNVTIKSMVTALTEMGNMVGEQIFLCGEGKGLLAQEFNTGLVESEELHPGRAV